MNSCHGKVLNCISLTNFIVVKNDCKMIVQPYYEMSSTTSVASTNFSSASALARSSAVASKKHVRTEPSLCWQYFIPTRNQRQQIIFTKCKICSKVYQHKNSTTTMLTHLRKEHSIYNNKPAAQDEYAADIDPSQQQHLSQLQPSQNSSPSSTPSQQQGVTR